MPNDKIDLYSFFPNVPKEVIDRSVSSLAEAHPAYYKTLMDVLNNGLEDRQLRWRFYHTTMLWLKRSLMKFDNSIKYGSVPISMEAYEAYHKYGASKISFIKKTWPEYDELSVHYFIRNLMEKTRSKSEMLEFAQNNQALITAELLTSDVPTKKYSKKTATEYLEDPEIFEIYQTFAKYAKVCGGNIAEVVKTCKYLMRVELKNNSNYIKDLLDYLKTHVTHVKYFIKNMDVNKLPVDELIVFDPNETNLSVNYNDIYAYYLVLLEQGKTIDEALEETARTFNQSYGDIKTIISVAFPEVCRSSRSPR